MAKKLAIAITRMSRWMTWLISWARTASISSASSVFRMPLVTATTECFGSRPVASALGTLLSMMATFGLGIPVRAESRPTMS